MQVVNQQLIQDKKVLLRLDIDVPIECKAQGVECKVSEDFRLRAGLATLKLCIEHASKVIIIGHLGRPFATVEDGKNGRPKDLSAKPVCEWYKQQLGLEIDFVDQLERAESSSFRVVMLENIRFFHGEMEGDVDFAGKLASLGEVFINEAFASYNPAASTTILPTLLPHACGLRFDEEVKKLKAVRENPKKPFVAIMGGAKVADKLPVIKVLAESADAVLVGGKLVSEIKDQQLELPKNVLVGMLTDDGLDIAPQTTAAWSNLISRAAEIVWNGPVGKTENDELRIMNYELEKESLGSARGTYELAKMVIESKAEIVIGGGDTIGFLGQAGLLEEFEQKAFVSTGGGAMLKFLTDGTLPTIEVLKT